MFYMESQRYIRDRGNLESQTFLIEMLKLTSCINLISYNKIVTAI